jgi:hypothetical protein
MARNANSRAAICCLCAILLVVCIFFSFLPHEHGCDGQECPICQLVTLFEVALLLLGVVSRLPGNDGSWDKTVSCRFPGRGSRTLVALKVKLSD